IYYSDASSLQNLSASEGWGVDAFFGGTLYLPGNLEFKSENRYEYSEATQVFDQDFERLIMNLHLSKNFLKSEAITLRISANEQSRMWALEGRPTVPVLRRQIIRRS